VKPGTSIADLIERQRPGHALEQAFYCDPELFSRDLDRVLMRHWLCAGHVSLVRDVGDYFLIELAQESVIIVRDEDGEIRALANVCRHRGSRVCAEARGRGKAFVCPYHAWTYGLDGRLIGAAQMPDDFDKAAHGLKRLALRVVQGVIFVSFAPSPIAFDNVHAVVEECLGPYGWQDARVAHRESYPIAANWKLAVENYLECYHCAPAHPEYTRLHGYAQPAAKVASLDAAAERRAAELGIVVKPQDHWVSSREGGEAAFGFRYALCAGVLTGSDGGTPVAPLMGRFTGYDGAVTSLHLGPASFLISYPDHGVIYRFIAASPDRCLLEVLWLVRGDAVEGRDYHRSQLTWLWRVTSEADKRIVEQNQLGVSSRFYLPGPYSRMEPKTQRFVAWYLGEIA
jgi:Rieske 2Fe-2S family protein